jgi:hypothetical protein
VFIEPSNSRTLKDFSHCLNINTELDVPIQQLALGTTYFLKELRNCSSNLMEEIYISFFFFVYFTAKKPGFTKKIFSKITKKTVGSNLEMDGVVRSICNL